MGVILKITIWFGHHFQIREQDYMGDHRKESS